MALVAGLQVTLNTYQILYNQAENDLCNITDAITQETSKTSDLSKSVADQKQEAKDSYKNGDIDQSAYQDAIEKISDDYTATLADVQSWETELEQQKDQAEQQAQQYSSYIDSYKSLVSKNVSSTFKYGGSGGS